MKNINGEIEELTLDPVEEESDAIERLIVALFIIIGVLILTALLFSFSIST